MLRFFGQYFIRQAASILLGLYVLYRSDDVGHLSDGYRTVVRQVSDDCPTPSGKPGKPLSFPFEDTDAGSGSTIKKRGSQGCVSLGTHVVRSLQESVRLITRILLHSRVVVNFALRNRQDGAVVIVVDVFFATGLIYMDALLVAPVAEGALVLAEELHAVLPQHIVNRHRSDIGISVDTVLTERIDVTGGLGGIPCLDSGLSGNQINFRQTDNLRVVHVDGVVASGILGRIEARIIIRLRIRLVLDELAAKPSGLALIAVP